MRNSYRKGEIWISVVIYVLVIVVVMVLILEAGIPALNSARDRSAFTRVKDTMTALDQHIADIANEGPGSQRVVPIDVPTGELEVKDNKLRWKMETDTKLIEPRSKIDQGNLIISSDVDVTAIEYPGFYTLENSRILINLTKSGDSSNWTSVNTSRTVNYVYFKEQTSQTTGTFKFLILSNESSATGSGYTKISDKGSSLSYSSVTVHVNNSAYEYDLKISLDSKADFFRAGIENFRAK